jgi:hypothetical protein
MVRAGRLARINVEITDLPGSLAKVTTCIAAQGANIDQVHHQRAFSKLTVQNAELDVVLKTRNREHVAEIIDALVAQASRLAPTRSNKPQERTHDHPAIAGRPEAFGRRRPQRPRLHLGPGARRRKADITVQTQQVLAKIDQLLREAGSDKTKLLWAQIFLPDMKDFTP